MEIESPLAGNKSRFNSWPGNRHQLLHRRLVILTWISRWCSWPRLFHWLIHSHQISKKFHTSWTSNITGGKVFLPKVAEIRKDLHLKRSELADLLFEEPEERAKIDELARKILASQAKLENEVIEHILEEKELLSPLQKRKFYEIIVEQFSSGGLGVHDVKGRKTWSPK